MTLTALRAWYEARWAGHGRRLQILTSLSTDLISFFQPRVCLEPRSAASNTVGPFPLLTRGPRNLPTFVRRLRLQTAREPMRTRTRNRAERPRVEGLAAAIAEPVDPAAGGRRVPQEPESQVRLVVLTKSSALRAVFVASYRHVMAKLDSKGCLFLLIRAGSLVRMRQDCSGGTGLGLLHMANWDLLGLGARFESPLLARRTIRRFAGLRHVTMPAREALQAR